MTEDALGSCSMLNNQLSESLTVPSEISIGPNSEGALYLNSNMTVDGSCLYTTSGLAGSFPEGTVLQILPDSTFLAVPSLKDSTNPNLSNTTLIFKDPSFTSELAAAQSTPSVSNLLVDSENQNELPEVSETNISDIDLSFLSETVDSISTTTSKALTDAAIKELQGSITSQSLDKLQSNSYNVGVNQELIPSLSDMSQDPEGPAEDVVMIDVSKPIQLSQNSLIMVNGQKCVLQQTQSGQVVAYPVKEQDKPRRRRGRPRKASIEHIPNESGLNLEESQEPEDVSDDEREHGLLQIVDNDGSLVRRSTRRRKKTKVLKDYETGNLKQELGSDIDDGDLIEIDPDLSRKRKPKGPGRPRKNPIPDSVVSGAKRSRGRPKKQVFENEPTQAFLVQTSDGQTLMMQVPLSSIPPNVTLQEVAQSIANRLTQNQANASSEVGNALQSINKSANDQNSEPAVQDHSIGSTTNLCNMEEFRNGDNVESNTDSSGQNVSTEEDHIVVDSVSDSEVNEITLNNGNPSNVPNNQHIEFLPENMLRSHSQFSNLEMPQSPEERYTLKVPASISSNNISSSLTSLTNQICTSKTDDQDIENFNQFQIPKDFLLSGEFIKGKMSLQDLLENMSNTETNETAAGKLDGSSQAIQTHGINNKENNPLNPSEFSLDDGNVCKDFEGNLATQITNAQKIGEEKQTFFQENCDITKSKTTASNFDFLTSDLSTSILGSNMEKEAKPNEAIISSIRHDHNLLAQSMPVSKSQESYKLNKTKFIKSKISAIKQKFKPILPLDTSPNLALTTSDNPVFPVSSMAIIPVSSDQHLELSEKILPIILPTQELPGSMKCKVCQRIYFSEEELIRHFQAEHPNCICKQCNYMSEYSYVIKRHSLRHSTNGIVCNLCGKQYKDHYILKMHIKMVHLPVEVVFTCEVCDKKFTRKAHLKRHLRIHAANRPYQCSICNYRGCEKSDITKHILIHEEPKHTCHICGKAFRHIKNKDLHLKRHFKQRDYKCGICNFYGYTFTDIRKHIERRHTDAKSSTCLKCGTIFLNKELLQEHNSSDQCKGVLKDAPVVKEESEEIRVEPSVLEELPLDLLESEQTEELNTANPAVSECSNFKTSTLSSGQLIMSSADSLLNNRNGQMVVDDLEGSDFLSSENLTFLNVENDSNKLITLVSNDGKSYTLPLKNSSETPEAVDRAAIADHNSKVETLFFSPLHEDEIT